MRLVRAVKKGSSSLSEKYRGLLTSCNRSMVLFLRVYSRIFPFGSQGMMMENRDDPSKTPRSGITFGCSRCFHNIILGYNP